MRELLYVPPGRRPATGLIGVLVPELENPIFPALAQAIEDARAPSGLRLDPLQHDGRRVPRGRLRAHAARPRASTG